MEWFLACSTPFSDQRDSLECVLVDCLSEFVLVGAVHLPQPHHIPNSHFSHILLLIILGLILDDDLFESGNVCGDQVGLVVLFFDLRGGEAGDDILDLRHVLECMREKEPIVEDKGQMILVLNLQMHFIPNSISIAHDGDEHVHQVDHEDEHCGEVD